MNRQSCNTNRIKDIHYIEGLSVNLDFTGISYTQSDNNIPMVRLCQVRTQFVFSVERKLCRQLTD